MMSRPFSARFLIGASVLATIAATGCKSTDSNTGSMRSYNWKELDAELPSGSTSTPSHRLPRYEYPFDSHGHYISSWAAEGERRNGRGAYASTRSSRRSSSSAAPSYSKPTPKPKPKPKPSYRYHTVAAGDTLYSLSRRYGTSVSRLKSINGLSSDLIVNGRKLKVP